MGAMRLKSAFAAAAAAAFFLLPQPVRAESNKEKAKAHFEQGEIFMKAGVYDKAIEEYQAAYALVPSAHLLLFNIGLAYENWGKRTEALEWYAKYRAADPKGPKATEATARSIAIERAIEREKKEAEERKKEEERRKADEEAQRKANEEATRRAADEAARRALAERREPNQTAVDATPKKKKGISWVWVAAGAAALGLGIVLDTVPKSAHDGKFEFTDLLPVGLYGASATFLVVGFF
jgi:tetratricopeptide (TPR) repeat protein